MTTTNPTSAELRAAARHNNLSLAKLYIDNGVDLDGRDEYGMTALMYAARIDKSMVSLLVNKGANIDLKNNHGKTALEWANEGGIHGAKEAERVKILQDATDVRQRLIEAKAAIEAGKAALGRIEKLHNTAVRRQSIINKMSPEVRVRPA